MPQRCGSRHRLNLLICRWRQITRNGFDDPWLSGNGPHLPGSRKGSGVFGVAGKLQLPDEIDDISEIDLTAITEGMTIVGVDGKRGGAFTV